MLYVICYAMRIFKASLTVFMKWNTLYDLCMFIGNNVTQPLTHLASNTSLQPRTLTARRKGIRPLWP